MKKAKNVGVKCMLFFVYRVATFMLYFKDFSSTLTNYLNAYAIMHIVGSMYQFNPAQYYTQA